MPAVIFEGGSLRGIFSAGVMDALLDSGVYFDYVIGVSAGISYGISYVSNQRGRNIEVIRKYRDDHRYLSKRNFLKCRSLFDLDFLFDEIPNKLNILDRNAIDEFNGTVLGAVTEAESGMPVYMDAKHMDKKLMLLRASCAIPFYTPPIFIDGKQYFDGGLSDSVPIKKAQADGNVKNLIVLTRPKGYRKKENKSSKTGAFLLKRKFPKLSEVLLNRSKMYNETMDYIDEIEENSPSDIVVIRPEYSLKSFESEVSVLENTYKHGYDMTMSDIDNIIGLFK